MKCEFCWDEDRGEPLTKEHLISQPVADAFHIDRQGSKVARFDRDAVDAGDFDSMTFCSLAELSVRIACARCNNGWMNELEHQMVEIARWARAGGRPLGKANLRNVSRWLLKTHAVMSVLDGATRRFVDPDGEIGSQVIPDPTRARLLRVDDDAAFDGVVIAAGRSNGEGFAYGFGNPEIRSTAANPPSARSAAVVAMSLGSLQLWAVVPWLRSGRVQLPSGLITLNARTRSKQLRTWLMCPRPIESSWTLDPLTLPSSRTLFWSGQRAKIRARPRAPTEPLPGANPVRSAGAAECRPSVLRFKNAEHPFDLAMRHNQREGRVACLHPQHRHRWIDRPQLPPGSLLWLVVDRNNVEVDPPDEWVRDP